MRRARDVVTEGGIEVQRSVVDGSEITGAPGQPRDTGFLASSFVPRRISSLEWEITTNVVYAPAVEEGQQQPYVRGSKLITPRPMQFQSAVGGAHSVALTRASWDRIADVVTERVTGGNP